MPIPSFYLLAAEDPTAQKSVLEFLNHWLNLQIDLRDLDEEITKQNENMGRMRDENPEIDLSISKLESNTRPDEGESEKLVKQVEEFLREHSN